MNFGRLLIILAIVLISTVLHELAHGGVAYLLGDTTAKDEGRLSLNPVKHIDPVMSIMANRTMNELTISLKLNSIDNFFLQIYELVAKFGLIK